MRAPLSIVIPTRNAANVLPATLASLIEGLEAGLLREVVISDGESDDETDVLAEAAGCVWRSGALGRGTQLARGAAAAGGAWLLFLHADTRLAPGWSAVVGAHMDQSARAGYFRLRFDDGGMGGRMVAGWANLRAHLLGLPYGDQGLLISRGLYDTVGGFGPIPLMEDVAMARALRGRLRALDCTATTSATRYRTSGWLRRGAGNLWRQARFLAGADPARLSKGYERD